MKLVADESVEGPTVAALRADGHTVIFIAEVSPGIDDMEVLAAARREETLLITADKDFGELVFRSGEPHFGVLLLRSLDGDADRKPENIRTVIARHGGNLANRSSVLAGGALRIRLRS